MQTLYSTSLLVVDHPTDTRAVVSSTLTARTKRSIASRYTNDMQQTGSMFILLALIATGVFFVAEERATPAGSLSGVSSVPFVELSRGQHAQITSRVNYLITSEEGLTELWKLLDSDSPAPAIDFSSRSVVAVFAGEQATGGHEISVTKIEDGSLRTVVVARTMSSDGCMVRQSLTTPYQVVEIPATTLSFTHTDVLVTKVCK